MKKSVFRKEGSWKKNLSVLALVAVIVVSAVGLVLGNDTTGADRPADSSGEGDRTNPYLIETVEDFLDLQKSSAEGEDFEGDYFLQTADLDFSDVEDFQPVSEFAGVYNGGGHKITGIRSNSHELMEYASLFREMNGILMNLGVEDCYFSATFAAGLVCMSDDEDAGIYNCYSTADVSGHFTGGIAVTFSGKIVSSFVKDAPQMKKIGDVGITIEDEIIDENDVAQSVTETLTDATSGGICGILSGSVIECISPTVPSGYYTINAKITGTDFDENMSESTLSDLRDRFCELTQEYVTPSTMLYTLFFSEEGTKKDPYQINNVEDFCRMRDLVNAGISFDAHWFRQTADLDLSEIDNFIPIGSDQGEHYFWGHYDGDGHTISNLMILAPDMDTGLFNRLAGSVMNLGIESGLIQGNCIGSFTGDTGSDTALILNCYSKAKLCATDRAGGIADRMFSASIANCCFTGTIESEGAAYGISTYQTSGRVINCRSTIYEPIGSGDDSNYGTRRVDTAEKAFDDVSASIYDSAARLSAHDIQFYRMDSEEGFTNVYPMKLALLWREALTLILILVAVFAVLLVWVKYSRPANSIASDGFLREGISGRWTQLTDTRVHKMKTAFYLTFGFCALMFFVGVLCGDKLILNAAVYSYGEDVFMDFYNPMHTALTRNVKEIGYFSVVGETYPPLAQGILWLLGQFMPAETAVSDALEVRETAYGLMLFFCVLAIGMFILYAIFQHTEKNSKSRIRYFLPFLFLLCPPIVFMVERGNILILAFVASALFVAGYRSESPLIRNLSYACLGFAAAIKIYPAVLGLLVLREKNTKHTLQCLSWGIGFMLIPFAFCGGMTSLTLYLRNIGVAFQKHSLGHDRWLLNYSNTLYCFTGSSDAGIALADSISKWTLYPFMALILIAGLVCRKRWKIMLAAILVLLLYPGFSLYYMGAFLLLPLFAFFCEEQHSRIDWIYLILLSLPILPLQFLCGIYGVNKYALPIVASLSILVLALFFIVETAVSFIRWHREKKEQSLL
ncbi:MAG: DUF2029 domain-containing protein [Clostridia bacterium]|nr:DUF2029 domain-containing protein [Clostridia bacterium]